VELLVIRHAIAEEPLDGIPDANRALTRKGRRRFRKVVAGLDRIGIVLGRVLHSPWRRAAETARLLEPIVRDDDALLATDALTTSPRAELISLIATTSTADPSAVVGHEPWLGELVALLAFGDVRNAESISLKKGAIAWLDGTPVPGGMTLRGLTPPSILRRLA
jgi:phosphohistidine phosphatase